MPRMRSIARRRPTRSSVVRCSDAVAGTSAVSVAIWRNHSFRRRAGIPGGALATRRAGISAASRAYPRRQHYWPGERRRRVPFVGVARPGVEPLWRARLRWRMKGAWLWPAFCVLTPLEAVVLNELPYYGTRGPGSLAAGFLLAGLFNLVLVAVVAPVAAWTLRRRRPDLPRVIARDTAGSVLLVAGLAALVIGGLVHRPVVLEAQGDAVAQFTAVHDYVVEREPAYRDALAVADTMRVEEDMYRTCLPGPDPRRWLCMFVRTDQDPPSVRVDGDRLPNDVYRLHGGFE